MHSRICEPAATAWWWLLLSELVSFISILYVSSEASQQYTMMIHGNFSLAHSISFDLVSLFAALLAIIIITIRHLTFHAPPTRYTLQGMRRAPFACAAALHIIDLYPEDAVAICQMNDGNEKSTLRCNEKINATKLNWLTESEFVVSACRRLQFCQDLFSSLHANFNLIIWKMYITNLTIYYGFGWKHALLQFSSREPADHSRTQNCLQ